MTVTNRQADSEAACWLDRAIFEPEALLKPRQPVVLSLTLNGSTISESLVSERRRPAGVRVTQRNRDKKEY